MWSHYNYTGCTINKIVNCYETGLKITKLKLVNTRKQELRVSQTILSSTL